MSIFTSKRKLKITVFCLAFFASVAARALEVTGVEGDALKNVQTRLQVLQQNRTTPPSSEEIKKNIQLALQPFGYFRSKVVAKKELKKGSWITSYQIIAGPVLYVTQAKIEVIGAGVNNNALQQALKDLPIRQGKSFNVTAYKNAKQKLFNLALQQGYLTAYFSKHVVNIDLKKYTCDVVLVLNTGPRFYFGNITFSQTPLNEKLLTKYLSFHSGQPFSSQALLTSQNNLSQSGYFSNVSIDSGLSQATQQQVPVNINLTMKKMQQWLAGVGFGTDTGPRITLGSNWRYINEEGHAINSQVVLSPVQNVAQVSYLIPGGNPVTDQYRFNASIITNHLNQGSSTTEQLGFNNVYAIDENWQRILALNYQLEQFQFNNQPAQNSHLLIPGVSWLYNSNKGLTFVNQGNRFLLSMQGSLQGGISDTRFFQTEVQDKYITHFTDSSRVIFRGDVGYSAIHDLDNFPLSLRFYAGGAQSVRGFTYQSLGPGKYLITGSSEFQQKIVGNWYGAVFFDTGNAMDQLNQPLERSSGVGLVWASPLGTMELSLAKALSLPGQPMRIQFVLGPDL